MIALFVGLLSLSFCNGSNEDLKSKLLPQIFEAYKNGKWKRVIQLTDSLQNNGISYTDYIGDKGFDVAYCEAMIATGQADKAVAEIRHHISTVNPQDFYAYHTLGIAYSELKDTFGAYILGAAATHQMDEPVVSQKLMDLANDIDSEAAKGHYEYFFSIINK